MSDGIVDNIKVNKIEGTNSVVVEFPNNSIIDLNYLKIILSNKNKEYIPIIDSVKNFCNPNIDKEKLDEELYVVQEDLFKKTGQGQYKDEVLNICEKVLKNEASSLPLADSPSVIQNVAYSLPLADSPSVIQNEESYIKHLPYKDPNSIKYIIKSNSNGNCKYYVVSGEIKKDDIITCEDNGKKQNNKSQIYPLKITDYKLENFYSTMKVGELEKVRNGNEYQMNISFPSNTKNKDSFIKIYHIVKKTEDRIFVSFPFTLIPDKTHYRGGDRSTLLDKLFDSHKKTKGEDKEIIYYCKCFSSINENEEIELKKGNVEFPFDMYEIKNQETTNEKRKLNNDPPMEGKNKRRKNSLITTTGIQNGVDMGKSVQESQNTTTNEEKENHMETFTSYEDNLNSLVEKESNATTSDEYNALLSGRIDTNSICESNPNEIENNELYTIQQRIQQRIQQPNSTTYSTTYPTTYPTTYSTIQ